MALLGALVALVSYSSAQTKIANSAATWRAWAVMCHVNLQRAQILFNAATTLLNLEKKNTDLDKLIGYERQMQNYTENMAITAETLKEYDELQEKITFGFVYVFGLLSTKYPDLKTREFFKDEPKRYVDKLVNQILEIDVAVESAKVNFDEAYKQYTQP
jgi:hypothetical protein